MGQSTPASAGPVVIPPPVPPGPSVGAPGPGAALSAAMTQVRMLQGMEGVKEGYITLPKTNSLPLKIMHSQKEN